MRYYGRVIAGTPLAKRCCECPVRLASRMKNPLRTRMFAWWYFTIAGGFVLLALNRWLLGQRVGLILAQAAAAVAFLLFGIISWNSPDS